MVTLVVHHFVEDFDTWKPVFDEHESVRRSHGEVEHRIYQDIHNPNRVIVHNDFPSPEDAQGFADDPSLPEAMERAGIVGAPGIGIAQLVEEKRYAEGAIGVTAVVHHPVRDYATWKPVFDDHESVRRAHGALAHRIYRYPGDDKSVVVHNDFPSEEAVDAFVSDPSLRDAMERGGVEGEPGLGRILCTERKVYD
jgi:quinol monooxygenase YgiN